MGRFVLAGFVSCMALCLAATAVGAEDEKGELERLRQENQGLKAAQLEQDVTAYLAETKGFEGAQGGDALKGVTLKASFVSVYQGVIGNTGTDVGEVGGDFDLNFDLQVSDDVSLFCYMTANTSTGASTFYDTNSFPGAFAPAGIGIATDAGLTDGMGVNGTVPTNPGAVTTNEVGIRVASHLGDRVLNWEMGELDPRNRFLQNAYVPDNNKTFLHNSFNDPASVEWITTSAGTTSLGWYMWMEFGAKKEWTLSAGWFNIPGQWFQQGQLYIQVAWKGEVKGREMNAKILFNLDSYNGQNGPGPGSAFATDKTGFVIGWSWDWSITDKVGVFFTGGFNTQNTNLVDYDFALGFVFQNMIQSRPDDQFGAGMVWTHLDKDTFGTANNDTEYAFELYYRFAMANGKVWVTPDFIFVNNPGGGKIPNGTFVDSSLFILGLRIYVPF
jgi:hypothetical protein